MTERPILFSGAMVRAILAGEKTQTRRVLSPQPDSDGWVEYGKLPSSAGSAYIGNATSGGICTRVVCPYGRPGDRLWVREAWQAIHVSIDPETGYGYDVDYARAVPDDDRNRWWRPVHRATDPNADACIEDRCFPWRPSIHMPRWASRITLEVTEVRVERLQAISEDDVEAEGVGLTEWNGHPGWPRTAGFAELWDSLAKPGAKWADDPWVWVVGFKRVEEARR